MGRKKNVLAPEANALNKLQADRATADKLWGDGLPFDQFRLEARIKSRNAVNAEIMIENGRDYRWLKEYVEHGEFTEAVKRTGVSYTWAYYCMRAAELFPNLHRGEDLDLNFRQVRALTVFEKPVVEEYLNGGSLGDIPHDDVSKMTGEELEKEARKLRKDLDTKTKALEAVIKQKNEKINDLEYELLNGEHRKPENIAQVKLDELKKKFIRALLDISVANAEATAVMEEAQKIEGITSEQLDRLLDSCNEFFGQVEGSREEYLDTVDNLRPIKENEE